MKSIRATPALLILSLLVLAPMIPGGPVENRTFPDMPVAVATSYNILIVIVGLATIPLAILTRRASRLWASFALVDALGFLGIYGFDLAHVFPGGPAMGAKLIVFESMGVLVAAALAVSAARDLSRPDAVTGQTTPVLSASMVLGLAAVCLLVGGVAVYFGTVHALH